MTLLVFCLPQSPHCHSVPNPRFILHLILETYMSCALKKFRPDFSFGYLPFPYSDQIQVRLVQGGGWGFPIPRPLERLKLRASARFLIHLLQYRLSSRGMEEFRKSFSFVQSFKSIFPSVDQHIHSSLHLPTFTPIQALFPSLPPHPLPLSLRSNQKPQLIKANCSLAI